MKRSEIELYREPDSTNKKTRTMNNKPRTKNEEQGTPVLFPTYRHGTRRSLDHLALSIKPKLLTEPVEQSETNQEQGTNNQSLITTNQSPITTNQKTYFSFASLFSFYETTPSIATSPTLESAHQIHEQIVLYIPIRYSTVH